MLAGKLNLECGGMRNGRIAPHGRRLAASTFLVCVLLLGLTGRAIASGGSLSGTAVYSDMNPASRVLVFVVQANVTGGVHQYKTLTNAQGEWSLSSIAPGEYRVDMIVVPASGTHETRNSQTVTLAEGQSIALGAISLGVPTASEAKTAAEIEAEIQAKLPEVGTIMVTVKTADGKPASGALLSIQSASSGGSSPVPSSGVVSETARPGPVTLSATDMPPDSATQVSASAQATVAANATTSVNLNLPPSSPLAVPAGATAHSSERDLTCSSTRSPANVQSRVAIAEPQR